MQTLMRLCGIPLRVLHEQVGLREVCADYLDRETAGEARLTIPLGSDETKEEEARLGAGARRLPSGYVESLALCRRFCAEAMDSDVLLFHSSALALDGGAYLFAAPSGTGKSTHAAYWRALLGERVTMINDDKPFLRREEGIWYVYGSPWKGKHGLGGNLRVPLRGICLLERGEENLLRAMKGEEAFPRLFAQTQRGESENQMRRELQLLSDLTERIPVWHLRCRADLAAAEVAYDGMVGGKR